MIRVGLIGYGYSGRVIHSRLIQSVEGLELRAVVSPSAERRRQAQLDWSIPTYSSPAQLFEKKDIDVVVITTPHHTHHFLGRASLEAGKPAVLDKPVTLTSEEAEDLITLSHQKRQMLTVFQNRRWDRDFLTVKKVLSDRSIGDVWWLESNVGRYGPTTGWRAERSSMGSLLHDWGVHLMDQVVLLWSLPRSLYARSHFRKWQGSVESFIRVELDYEGERTAVVEVNYLRACEKPRWYVLGDEGGLIVFGLDPQEKALQEGDVERAKGLSTLQISLLTQTEGRIGQRPMEPVRGDWRDFYHNVRDVLEGRGELAVRPEETLEVLRLMEKALLSARSGERIRLT